MLFFGRGKDKESTALAGGGGGVARLRAQEYIAFQQCGFTMIIVVSVPIMGNGCFRRDDGVGYCGVDAGMLTYSDAWWYCSFSDDDHQ